MLMGYLDSAYLALTLLLPPDPPASQPYDTYLWNAPNSERWLQHRLPIDRAVGPPS
jgi:hypothetical protein